jgi:hypothetical protein
VTVFAVHLITGLTVMRITGREEGASDTNEWLTAAGVVLFVSGLVWTLLQFDPLEFGRFELQTAVLASSMGLLTGVVTSNLAVGFSVDLPTWRSEAEEKVTEAESKPHSRTTRRVPRSDTQTADATGSKTSSRTETGTSDSLSSLERLQETVRSLRRR